MRVRITAIHEKDAHSWNREKLIGLEGLDPIIKPTCHPHLFGWSYLNFPAGLIGSPSVWCFLAALYEEIPDNLN
jgi:hypothetical protein